MIHKSPILALLALVFSLLALPCQASDAESAKELELPQPNGQHPVGNKTILLKDSHRSRELMVTMWYPAMDGTSAFAAYMDKKTADALADEWKLEPGFERHVHPHSRVMAPIAAGGPFPVVCLEHGSGVVPAIYRVLAEGLASNGFIVVATNHPPDSLIAVFPDGHEVRGKPYWPVDADRKTQGTAIGKFAEDVLVAGGAALIPGWPTLAGLVYARVGHSALQF